MRRNLILQGTEKTAPSKIILLVNPINYRALSINSLTGKNVVVKDEDGNVLLNLPGKTTTNNPINISINWNGDKLVYIDCEELNKISFAYSHSIIKVKSLELNQKVDCSSMFYSCRSLTHVENIQVFGFKTNKLSSMFYGCSSLIYVQPFIINKNTYMGNMFCGCPSLTSAPNINYENSVDMTGIFQQCINLTDISNILNRQLSTVITMSSAFYGCTSLSGTIENLDAPLCVNMYSIFTYTNISTLKNINAPSAIYIYFEGMLNLTNVENINLISVNNATDLFKNCEKLVSISGLKLHQTDLIRATNMFRGCKSLVDMPALDFSRIQIAESMFEDCINLKNIYQSIDLTNCSSMSNMFKNCKKLTSIQFINNNCDYAIAAFMGCESLAAFPNLNYSNIISMTSTFQGCTSLPSSFNISLNNATNINSCFQDCTQLTSVTINGPKLDACNSAFKNCTSLSNVEIITNVASNYESTFENCISLTTLPNINYKGLNFDKMFKNSGITEISNLVIELFHSNLSYYDNQYSASSMFSVCTNLTTVNNFQIKVNIHTNNSWGNRHNVVISDMFANCGSLSEFDGFSIIKLDSNKIIKLYNMFIDCSNLTRVDNFDLNNVSNTYNLFYNSGLTEYNNINLNIPGLQSIEGMFSNTKIVEVNGLNTTAQTANNLFYNCTNLTKINISNSNILSASYMFAYCNNLITVENITLNSATYISYMFEQCQKLETVESINILSCNRIDSIFAYCEKLTSVNFNTSNIQYASNAFYGCASLSTIPTINGKILSAHSMFRYSGITSYDNSLDLSECSNIAYIFESCSKLINISNLSISTSVTAPYSIVNCIALKYVNNVDGINFGNTSNTLFNNCDNIIELDYLNYRSGFNVPVLITNPTKLEKIINNAGIPLSSYNNTYNIINIGQARKATIAQSVIDNAISKGWIIQ